jgi:sigma-E factor negative regulatory protein RseC
MTKEKDNITHPGIVHDIDNHRIYVKILSQSACSSCHAKGMCSIADMEEKLIDVKLPQSKTYKIGDKVIVGMERSLGSRAVLLGYFVPFLVLLITLIITLTVTANELLSGLLSISVLVPYYLALYLLNDKLKKTFEFRIKE